MAVSRVCCRGRRVGARTGLLLFKQCYWDAIRRGQKRTTIRRWDYARVRAGSRAFSNGLGWVHVEAVERIDLKHLTDADAHADGFASRSAMKRALLSHYPRATGDGKAWFRVVFRLETGAG